MGQKGTPAASLLLVLAQQSGNLSGVPRTATHKKPAQGVAECVGLICSCRHKSGWCHNCTWDSGLEPTTLNQWDSVTVCLFESVPLFPVLFSTSIQAQHPAQELLDVTNAIFHKASTSSLPSIRISCRKWGDLLRHLPPVLLSAGGHTHIAR